MKLRIALFKHLEYDWIRIMEEDDVIRRADYDGSFAKEYVQVSEYIDVDFPELDHNDVVTASVAALKDQIAAINAAAGSKVNAIEKQIAELLALPAPGADDE